MRFRRVIPYACVLGLLLMFLQSPAELAPVEDQDVIFGILDTPANATVDQMSVVARAVFDVYKRVPEMQQTFQLTQADSGIAGFVTEPWGERTRTIQTILSEVQRDLAEIPGARLLAVVPPALPGGGQFPVEFVIASTAETNEMVGFAQRLAESAAASGIFAFPPFWSM